MSTATIGGLRVLSLRITESTGAWLAELEADGDALPDGAVLDVAGEKWTGTAWSADVYAGRLRATIVGGAGGLATELDAKSYRGAAYGAILADVLTKSGETASSSSVDLSSSVAPAWTRTAGRVDQALDELAAGLALTWRVLRDGTIWFGSDAWETVSPDYVLISRDPAQRIDLIAPKVPIVRPGQSFDGHHVDRVVTTIGGPGLRQEIWWSEAGGEPDTIAAILGRWADRTIGRRLDYLALYPATVAKQAGDGALELVPDDPRIKGFGLLPLRIRNGLPGLKVTVPSGARVLIGFEAGDPTRPYAALWDPECGVSSVVFDGGDHEVARKTDTVNCGYLVMQTSPTPATRYYGFDDEALAMADVAAVAGSGGAATYVALDGQITSGNAKLKA